MGCVIGFGLNVVASVSVGAADAAIEAVIQHLSARKQFGKQLKEFQVRINFTFESRIFDWFYYDIILSFVMVLK